jgi:hypothetical protein
MRGSRTFETHFILKGQNISRPHSNVFFALRAFVAFVGVEATVSGKEYIEITASITQTNLSEKNPQKKQWSFPVMCTVSSDEWRIDNAYPSNGTEEWYYDGTNVFHLLKANVATNPYSSAEITKPHDSTQKLQEQVTVVITPSPGGHPLGNLGVNIPWLAFCSGSYLKRDGRIIPLPVAEVPGRLDSFAYLDKTETFSDAFGLPKLIELSTSRSQYAKSLYDSRLYRTERLFQARLHTDSRFKDGCIAFRYIVETSTNFNGWTFPTEFTYFDYRFKQYQRDSTNEWELFAVGKGKVNSVGSGKKPENVLRADAKQTVIDRRFRHPERLLDAITYQWSDSAVPATNNPVLRDRFSEMAIHAAVERRAHPLLIRLPIFAVFLLPIGYFWFKSLQKRFAKEPSQASAHLTSKTQS